MKRATQILIATLALIGLAHAGEGFGELTVDQVQAKLKQKDVYVFDCNDSGTFQSGHVPGAKLLDYPAATEKDFPANKKATLIFYCMNEH
jgi:rhodanese-related sulfurtransferase